MEEIKKVFAQLAEIWAKLGSRARFSLTFGGLLAVALIAAVWLSSRPTYGLLFRLDDPAEAAEVVTALDTAKIPYRSSGGGMLIEVPTTDIDRARMLLASQRLPKGGAVGFSDIYDDPKPGVTRESERVNFLRALQGELQRSIASLDAVKAARVHLTLPKKTPFRSERAQPSASVVIDIGSHQIARESVAAIQHLVAAGVERLEPSKVVVVTTEGAKLTGVGEVEAGGLDYKQELEDSLENKIRGQLEQVVGIGGVIASVEADIDFSRTSTRDETFDPEQIAIRSESTEELNEKQNGAATGGIAGALANQPNAAPAGRAGSSGATTRKVVNKNYEVTRQVVETQSPQATLKRLTIAVLVDGMYTTPEDGGEPVFTPRGQQELTELQQLVENAVGYNSTRGDRLTIACKQFVARPKVGDPVPFADDGLPSWWPYAAGGAAFTILALIAFMLSRKRKGANYAQAEVLSFPTRVDEAQRAFAAAENGQLDPAALPPSEQLPLAPTIEQLRTDVMDAAEQDPERAAEVVKAWIREDAAS